MIFTTNVPPRTASAGTGRGSTTFEGLVRIIRAEFEGMPGMRLTRAQFRRLWALTESDCDRLLRHLLGSGFLTESGRGVGHPSAL